MGPGGELARWRGPNPLSPASGQQPTPRRRSPGPPCLLRGPRPRSAPVPPHSAATDGAGAARPRLHPAAAQVPTAPPTQLASLPSLGSAGALSPGQPQKAAPAACTDASVFALEPRMADAPECCVRPGGVMSVELRRPKTLPQPKAPPFVCGTDLQCAKDGAGRRTRQW